jgi:hypothetical protein
MVLISSGYGTTIQSLLIDKPHSMDAPNWTFKMVTKYFVIRPEFKPKDYGPKKQDSNLIRQDSSSKK